MKTLKLIEAAHFLNLHPQTLRQKAKRGEIPAAKPGRAWCFLQEDLAGYLRAQYREVHHEGRAATEDLRWHCTSGARFGGSASRIRPGKKYADLLKLESDAKPRSSTTS